MLFARRYMRAVSATDGRRPSSPPVDPALWALAAAARRRRASQAIMPVTGQVLQRQRAELNRLAQHEFAGTS